MPCVFEEHRTQLFTKIFPFYRCWEKNETELVDLIKRHIFLVIIIKRAIFFCRIWWWWWYRICVPIKNHHFVFISYIRRFNASRCFLSNRARFLNPRIYCVLKRMKKKRENLFNWSNELTFRFAVAGVKKKSHNVDIIADSHLLKGERDCTRNEMM